jgi:hypothetical protein
LAHSVISYLMGEKPTSFVNHEFGKLDVNAEAQARDARRAVHKARWEMHMAKWTYRLANQLVAKGHNQSFAMDLARKIQRHLDTCPHCWNGDELRPCDAYRAL